MQDADGGKDGKAGSGESLDCIDPSEARFSLQVKLDTA